MNSEDLTPSPREELEAQITALLLGELSETEAAALREKIAADPELIQLHTRLGLTMGLVKEALASPEPAEMTAPEGLKLSEERREKLLASFKVTAPPEFADRSVVRSWLALAAMIACLFMLAGLFMPALSKSKAKAKRLTLLGPQPANVSDESLELTLPGGGMDQTVRADVSTTPAAAAEIAKLSDSDGRGRANFRFLQESRRKSDKKSLGEVQVGQKVQIELPKSEDFFAARGEVSQPTTAGGVPFGSVPAKPRAASEGKSNQEFASFGFGANQPQSDAPVSSFGRTSNSGPGGFFSFGGGGGGAQATRGFADSEAANGAVNLGFAVKNETALGLNNWAAPATGDGSLSGIGSRSAALDRMEQQAEKNRFIGRYDSAGIANAPVDVNRLAAVDSLSTVTRGQAASVTDFSLDSANTAGAEAVRRSPGQIEARRGGEPALGEVPQLGRLFAGTTTSSPASGPATAQAGRELAERDAFRSKSSVVEETLSARQEPRGEFGGRGLERSARPALTPPPAPVMRAPLAAKSGVDAKKTGERVDDLADGIAAVGDGVSAKGKNAEEGEMVGGMGGGADMSMKYYVSNPELMKRYFPRMYEQMQQGKNGRLPEAAEKAPESTTASIEPLTGLPVAGETVTGLAIDPLTGLPTQASEGRIYSPVEQKARELEVRKGIRDSLAVRLAKEKVDQNIPKAETVQVLDLAEAGKPSLLERFRGAERVAKVELSKDVSDVSPLMAASSVVGNTFDPFFLQTETEKVRSQKVLNEVAQKLNLSDAWGEKYGVDKLDANQTQEILKKMVDVRQSKGASLMEIGVKSDKPEEAAKIANTIAEVYLEQRNKQRADAENLGAVALQYELAKQDEKLAEARKELEALKQEVKGEVSQAKPVSVAGAPQPEVATAANAFSTFSLNVSDVSFKLAAASLEKGLMPEPATVRSEEFINAFDYRDPAAVGSARVAFAWERARYPFAHDRDLLRFSVKTAASGREAGRPLNLVLLLDNSGSMERADRVRIIQECLRILTGQLQAQDKISVVTFARTARLRVDGLAGNAAGDLPARVGEFTPEGGTNLEEAMRVAYETAAKHFQTNGVNRVVLLTDGAANLGDVKAESLKQKVELKRKEGIALDCFGIGWEGLNDDLLEQLSRNGDGRYGFVNSAEAASAEFAGQLAGALKVAASDVKVQVEFNPKRTTTYRQIGYAKHQLTKEQFRDNSVDAAEIGAAEAGNALYVAQVNPAGEGPIATVRARFKVPGTNDYREHEWTVPYEGASKGLEQSSPAMRLAGASSAFSEWLVASPYAGEVTPDRLLGLMGNVPEAFANDGRPKQLEWMIRQAKSVAGK